MYQNPFPKSLRLSNSIYAGRNGKQVSYYCTINRHFTSGKAVDHELLMRQADSKLLQALINEYYDQVKVLVASGKIEDNQAPQAMDLLKTCWRALGKDGDKNENFIHMQPYGAELINLAASYVDMALQVLVLPPAQDKGLYELRNQLGMIAATACARYEVVTYAESLITEKHA